MKFVEIIKSVLIDLAICCLRPWLIMPAGTIAIKLLRAEPWLIWLITAGALLLILMMWREHKDRRACRRLNSSAPIEP